MSREYQQDNPRYTENERMAKGTSGAPLLAGFMIGGLIGAASMLLFAPQSGRETREAVQAGANDLRDRATDTAQRTVGQARSKAQQIASDARDRANDLQNRGMDLAADQLDRVAKAAQSGKKAIQANKNS